MSQGLQKQALPSQGQGRILQQNPHSKYRVKVNYYSKILTVRTGSWLINTTKPSQLVQDQGQILQQNLQSKVQGQDQIQQIYMIKVKYYNEGQHGNM